MSCSPRKAPSCSASSLSSTSASPLCAAPPPALLLLLLLLLSLSLSLLLPLSLPLPRARAGAHQPASRQAAHRARRAQALLLRLRVGPRARLPQLHARPRPHLGVLRCRRLLRRTLCPRPLVDAGCVARPLLARPTPAAARSLPVPPPAAESLRVIRTLRVIRLFYLSETQAPRPPARPAHAPFAHALARDAPALADSPLCGRRRSGKGRCIGKNALH